MKKAENTGNYIDISFSNKRNNVFLLLLYKSYYLNLVTFAVAPLAGAWVEIAHSKTYNSSNYVAPLAGAWVEIYDDGALTVKYGSLPSRERGLKFRRPIAFNVLVPSLPSRERGLKLQLPERLQILQEVAPLAGAWVEISFYRDGTTASRSLPSRERGLK